MPPRCRRPRSSQPRCASETQELETPERARSQARRPRASRRRGPRPRATSGRRADGRDRARPPRRSGRPGSSDERARTPSLARSHRELRSPCQASCATVRRLDPVRGSRINVEPTPLLREPRSAEDSVRRPAGTHLVFQVHSGRGPRQGGVPASGRSATGSSACREGRDGPPGPS